jgi:hypothetical protein
MNNQFDPITLGVPDAALDLLAMKAALEDPAR